MLKRKNAQSILEYVALLACVAVAIIAIQVYATRAFQGRFKTLADEIGDQYAPPGENTITSVMSASSDTISVVVLDEAPEGGDYLMRQIDTTVSDTTDIVEDRQVPLPN